ncbi:integral membrane protein 2Ba isoform X2 [Tachysurus fulvidraco]|uniref:integral membrane protein 2Ba isoform X2 n=1 Tax=Tachysurus fulvidraco TaxID=1234273 RepID=UPI000F4EA657|nr:integral membrane protein 2Ba isoform X2 [Tachysurus fulvidraco]
MVKVTFNSALAHKELEKGERDEALIPQEGEVLRVRQRSWAWCWCVFLGLVLLLPGVVVGGIYLYERYSSRDFFSGELDGAVPQEDEVYFCGLSYSQENYMVPDSEEYSAPLKRIDERVRILEKQQVELISVPVPEFSDSNAAEIVHDFVLNLTAYLDLSLNKCYITPLNTSVVMPPRDLIDLLINIEAGTYLPQSYMVREQMVVTEKVEDMEQLGYSIYMLCKDKDTYNLQRRDTISGIQKREALNCHKIRHFENKFVLETLICE